MSLRSRLLTAAASACAVAIVGLAAAPGIALASDASSMATVSRMAGSSDLQCYQPLLDTTKDHIFGGDTGKLTAAMQTLEHKWGIQVYVRGVETTPSGTATGYASDLLAACPNMTFEGKPISNFLMVVVLMHPGPGSPTKHQDTIIYGTQAGSYPNDLSAIRADMESNLGAHHQYVQAVATAMSYINDVLSGKPDPAIHHNPTWETVLKWIAVIAIIVVAILAAIFGKGSSGGRRGYYYVGGGSTGGSTPSTGSSGATSGGFN